MILADTLITRMNLILEQELKKKKSDSSAADTVENIRSKSQMPDMTTEGLFNNLLMKLLDVIEMLKESLL